MKLINSLTYEGTPDLQFITDESLEQQLRYSTLYALPGWHSLITRWERQDMLFNQDVGSSVCMRVMGAMGK